MSKLSSLIGKPKTFTIGELELEISPLGLEDLELFMNLGEPDKKGESMKQIIRKTLKRAVPDASEDELNKFGVTYLKDISSAIMSVNGLNAVS